MERRIEMGETLRASVEVLKGAAADGFGERFAAELRVGETLPDQALAMDLVGRKVSSALGVLTDAEQQYIQLGTQRVRERDECERIARQELNPRMVVLRRTIDALYGKAGGVYIHGLKGKTRRKPGRVLSQARDMVAMLKMKPRRPGLATSERAAWLRQVEPAYDELATSMEQLQRLERKEARARGVRNRALEQFDAVHGEAIAYIQSLYRLVGLHEWVVRKLRPEIERRRLMREARRERKAREDGRRRAAVQPIRSVVRMAARWAGALRWPRRVA